MIEYIKTLLRDDLGISSDVVLVIAGILAHIVLCLILRKPIYSAWGLLAPLILGITLESYEIWIHYRNIGLFAEGNDPLFVILLRHSFDIIKLLSLPVLLVVIHKVFFNNH